MTKRYTTGFDLFPTLRKYRELKLKTSHRDIQNARLIDIALFFVTLPFSILYIFSLLALHFFNRLSAKKSRIVRGVNPGRALFHTVNSRRPIAD